MARFSFLFPSPQRMAQEITAATALGVFLGVIGPFGSFYGGGVELRIAYWTLNIWTGYAIMSVTARLSVRVADEVDVPSWFSLGVGVALGAIPLTLVIHVMSFFIWPPARRAPDPIPNLYVQCLALAEPFTFAYALLLGGGVIPKSTRAGRGAKARRTEASGAEDGAAPVDDVAAGAQAAPFLSRLPGRLGQDLLCLTMEDHYVRAHTALGSDLVLIPLKQALTELADLEGLKVHRSAWVARSAVQETVQRDRSVALRLKNGLLVPVSRTSVARLKEAGWL
jgi:hypothetical protein